jgi:hypothetical protein
MLDDAGVFVIESYRPPPGDSAPKDGKRSVAYSRLVRTSNGARRYEARLCYQNEDELDAIANEAGLVLRERWSNWQGAPHTSESPMHVSLYGLKPTKDSTKL